MKGLIIWTDTDGAQLPVPTAIAVHFIAPRKPPKCRCRKCRKHHARYERRRRVMLKVEAIKWLGRQV